MTPGERTKLAAVLGRLGSEHAGERDAAALAADRLVRGRGLTWDAVLLEPARPHARAEPRPGLDDLAVCGRALDKLTPWEAEFIMGCAKQRTVSLKQQAIISRIAARLRGAA